MTIDVRHLRARILCGIAAAFVTGGSLVGLAHANEPAAGADSAAADARVAQIAMPAPAASDARAEASSEVVSHDTDAESRAKRPRCVQRYKLGTVCRRSER
jgi:hypothetical protein